MKIQNLVLRNFKGIKEFELNAGGKDVSVYADNGLGKTTIADSFNWLLFGKDSLGRAKFEIKTLDSNGNVIHGLEHEVEGTFDVGGKQLKLKKVYKEKWTKKKGQATATFTGHTTDHFIDDVPVNEKVFAAKIAEIVNEDIFRLLTSPLFFNEQLHWEKRREIILQVCGDVSDDEVISSDKALVDLPSILNGRLLDDHRKVVAAQKAKINGELKDIPIRINEVNRSLPDVLELNGFEIEGKVIDLKAKLETKRQEIMTIQSGGEVAEKVKELRELESKILDIQNEHKKKQHELTFAKRSELLEVKGRLQEVEQNIKSKNRIIEANTENVTSRENTIKELRNLWTATNDEQFNLVMESICPTCKQELPEEEIENARSCAIANFNHLKAVKLTNISTDGKKYSKIVADLKDENIYLREEIERFESQKITLLSQETTLQTELDELSAGVTDITANTEYMAAGKEKSELINKIEQLKTSNHDLLLTAKSEAAFIEQELNVYQGQVKDIETHTKGQIRIEELMAQEKKLAGEYEKLERESYLCDQFIKTKVSILEVRINNFFKMARFKMFNVLVNGAIEPMCSVTYGGVPFESLNNAGRINVGLDIINTLAAHYKFNAPIIVDNAEAVNELLPVDAQLIRLIVSRDKNLRVEVL